MLMLLKLNFYIFTPPDKITILKDIYINLNIKLIKMLNFLGIIPARYASTRFPGKPLVNINGKSMIQRVYEKASETLNNVIVATDDDRIIKEVINFGGTAVLTSEAHKSGTDRCYEALLSHQKNTGENFDVVINIQGDEPFIQPLQIELLKNCFTDESISIATLIKQIENQEVLFDTNRPKVAINEKHEALLFSRSTIPFIRDYKKEDWLKHHKFYQHIGMYAYRTKVLGEITKLKQSTLEKVESLEQLRWLENGYKIKTAITDYESYGIDTPEDLDKALSAGII
jgi:3-deoxy-manno-octulosonate cytidylyltransferase (CMP-KDO synthetase)